MMHNGSGSMQIGPGPFIFACGYACLETVFGCQMTAFSIMIIDDIRCVTGVRQLQVESNLMFNAAVHK
jgi:hypothetical protein